MCCLSAAWVQGMFSRVLDFCVKSCFFASFTSLLSLVLSCISTTNRSSSNIYPPLTSLGMHRSSLKVPFTTGKSFQLSHAVFFPLPANEDIVSQSVKAWKTGRVRHCVGFVVGTISWTAMYRKLDPTRKRTHSSSRAILLNEATVSTTTSVSTIRMVTFLHPFCKASATYRSRRV